MPIETQRRGVVAKLTAACLQDGLGEVLAHASRACMSTLAFRMAAMFMRAASRSS